MTLTTIPARHGIATPMKTGQVIKIINTHGNQVVDTFAFTLSPSSEIATQMSMQHTRASLCRVIPKVGDGLYNNERKKMFTIVEDTTEGIHDTMIAACDRQRYEELGGGSEHRNCADNLVEGLSAIGMSLFISKLFLLGFGLCVLEVKILDKRLVGRKQLRLDG
jgi:uncharacterized protein YcgI (DUF1989 family)